MVSKAATEAKDIWSSTADGLLSQDEVESTYDRLGNLNVTLDDDPLTLGPKRLQTKVAECRKVLQDCENIFLDVSHRLHRGKRELRAKQAALDLSSKYLFAQDPEVRAGRNVSDREALAAVKMKDEWLEVKRLEQDVLALEAVLLVVKAKRSDLRDTQGRLRDQMRLCQAELELGGRWGSRIPNARELDPSRGTATDADVKAIEDLIGGIEAEIHLPTGGSGVVDADDADDDEPEPVAPVTKAQMKDLEKDLDLPDANIDEALDAVLSTDPSGIASPEGDKANLTELLPGSGASDADVDAALDGVQIPQKMPARKSALEDTDDLDSLINSFGG